MLWMSPHPEMQGTFIAGDTWSAECTCLLEAAHIEIQTVLMETIIQDILNVSKSVACQKCVHIKACVATGNAPRGWVQVKMTFILYLAGSTILWLKGIIALIYCTSCRKQCKNWWLVISGMKHWGMFPTSITISLQMREVQRSSNAPCDYTYTGSSGKQSCTWHFLDIEGASDSTSHDIKRLPNGMGLETHCSVGTAACWVAEKIQPLSKEIFCRGI